MWRVLVLIVTCLCCVLGNAQEAGASSRVTALQSESRQSYFKVASPKVGIAEHLLAFEGQNNWGQVNINGVTINAGEVASQAIELDHGKLMVKVNGYGNLPDRKDVARMDLFLSRAFSGELIAVDVYAEVEADGTSPFSKKVEYDPYSHFNGEHHLIQFSLDTHGWVQAYQVGSRFFETTGDLSPRWGFVELHVPDPTVVRLKPQWPTSIPEQQALLLYRRSEFSVRSLYPRKTFSVKDKSGWPLVTANRSQRNGVTSATFAWSFSSNREVSLAVQSGFEPVDPMHDQRAHFLLPGSQVLGCFAVLVRDPTQSEMAEQAASRTQGKRDKKKSEHVFVYSATAGSTDIEVDLPIVSDRELAQVRMLIFVRCADGSLISHASQWLSFWLVPEPRDVPLDWIQDPQSGK